MTPIKSLRFSNRHTFVPSHDGHGQAQAVGATVARALMNERYERRYGSAGSARPADGAAIGVAPAIYVYATDVAIETATMCYHFAGNTALRTRMSSAVCCATSTSPAFTR
jgi:hypothetical protein